jgi:hypothetical protein
MAGSCAKSEANLEGRNNYMNKNVQTKNKPSGSETHTHTYMEERDEIFDCVRFEVFTAVTMKNGVFWDIETQFVPHRRYITPLLQSPAS